MQWELLGTLRVFNDGEELTFRGQRARDLLAVLVINRGSTISADALIDELWPDDPPASARNSVQRFVSDVRAGLGPERDRLLASRAGYTIDVADDEVDIAEVEQTIRAVSDRDDPLHSVRTFRKTISRLKGRLCAGSDALPSIRAEAQRLDGLRMRAIEDASALAAEHCIDIVEDLEEWFRDYPFNERIAGQLMSALARNGRQRDALAIHREIRSRLQQELGVSPGSELDQIEQDILSQKIKSPLERTISPPAHAPTTRRDHLVGRSGVVAQVRKTLEQTRLVTLTGMGGVGKTAVALEIAAHFGAGKALVARLANVTSGDAVIESVAHSMGLGPTSTERPTDIVVEDIGRYLAVNAELLVIDNAEHLIDAVAGLVVRLLEVPGAGRILVTSRERLAVGGESIVPVDPLDLPDEGSDAKQSAAVELFVMRGSETGAYTTTELLEHEATARICRMLDGLPLALELAAVQLPVFPPGQLADRLDVSMDALGRRRAAGQKGSLTDVLAWSWELLRPEERDLLAELALYSGWATETVEFLEPEDGIQLLQSLVDKSLVAVERSDTEPVRFSILETVRQFAYHELARSSRLDEAHRRHADWMLDLATTPSLVESLISLPAMTPLFVERSNLLRSLDWLKANEEHEDYVRLLTFAAGSIAHYGSALEARDHYLHAVKIARDLMETVDDGSELRWLDNDSFGALLTAACDVGNAAADFESALALGLEAAALVNGHSFDWAPGVLGTIAVIIESVLLDHAAIHLLDDAVVMAPDTPSAALNQAQVACWRGLAELINRRYASSLESFNSALDADPPHGRVLLLSETGKAITLLALGRVDEAGSFVETIQSQSGSDNWHYLVEIVSAVVISANDPAAGLSRLEASLGPSSDTEVGGYVADMRIAAGVVAHHVGDAALSHELLSGSFGRSPITQLLVVEYSNGHPWSELTRDEWTDRWQKVVLELFVTDDAPPETWVASRPSGRPVRRALSELRRAGLSTPTSE